MYNIQYLLHRILDRQLFSQIDGMMWDERKQIIPKIT